MPIFRHFLVAAAMLAIPGAAWATQPKIDPETCTALRLEQIKFRQSGILDEMNKGAGWAKANLSPEKLRDIQRYLAIDEQVKFGCRDAKLSLEAQRASEAAARIELNSDADPTAPIANDPPKPGAATGEPAAKKKPAQKKAKPADAKANGEKPKKSQKSKTSDAREIPPPPVISEAATVRDAEPPATSHFTPEPETPTLPKFGFGETTILPHSAP